MKVANEQEIMRNRIIYSHLDKYDEEIRLSILS